MRNRRFRIQYAIASGDKTTIQINISHTRHGLCLPGSEQNDAVSDTTTADQGWDAGNKILSIKK